MWDDCGTKRTTPVDNNVTSNLRVGMQAVRNLAAWRIGSLTKCFGLPMSSVGIAVARDINALMDFFFIYVNFDFSSCPKRIWRVQDSIGDNM